MSWSRMGSGPGLQYPRVPGHEIAGRIDAIGVDVANWKAGQRVAHEYIDTSAGAPAEAIQKLGGARVILATAPDAKSISALIDGLTPGGKLVIVGAAPEPLSVSPLQIIMARRSIQGWPSGTAKDSEDTLQFSALTGVRPMIERYPLGKAADAYDQMISGRARFRVVLTVAS